VAQARQVPARIDAKERLSEPVNLWGGV
jgi:hypothetical protein